MYDLKELCEYVKYSDIIRYDKETLKRNLFSNKVVEILSIVGIPEDTGFDISFVPIEKGGLSKLEDLNGEYLNLETSKVNMNNSLLLAEHNNTLIVRNDEGVICNFDYENDYVIYTNKDFDSFLECVIALNKRIFEVRTKFPSDFFAVHFSDDIIEEIKTEMIKIDNSIAREESFWLFLLEDIVDLRD